MQKISFYLDDSGNMSLSAPSDYLVFGGLLLVGLDEEKEARNSYKQTLNDIKLRTNLTREVKANNSPDWEAEKLIGCVSDFRKVAIVANRKMIPEDLLKNKGAVKRYRDFMLRKLVFKQIQKLIFEGLIDPFEDVELKIIMDENITNAKPYYAPANLLIDELTLGIHNGDYSRFEKPLLQGKLSIASSEVNSKHNPLVQAADFVVNAIWNSYMASSSIEELNLPKLHCQSV
ncbi:MAG: DUF3800 domain-containing protein [Lactobacillaceae bacterium]|nr:DUF3800 domain-containing protein [Lactobacillaceae bacterium]